MGIEMTYLCDDELAASQQMKNRITHFRFASILSIMLLLSIQSLYAQAPVTVSNQIETYEGKRYYLHTVEPRQTLYGISRAYNVTVDDLKRANPESGSGLRVNQVLRIPVTDQSPQPQSPQAQRTQQDPQAPAEEMTEPAIADRYEYIYHVTGKRETFSYIADIYMVPVNRISAANPGMREPIREGEYVVVPIAPKAEVAPVNTQPRGSDYDPFRSPPVRTVGQQSREQTQASSSTTAQLGREPVQPPSQQRVEPNRSLTDRPELTREMIEESSSGVETISPFNIPGQESPSRYETASASRVAAPSGQQHVVKPRETLFSIAQQYGLSVDGLMALNPGISQMLSVGQVLVVSDKPGERQAETPQEQPEEEFMTHVVKKGETLYRIARNYAVGIPELKKHNPGLTEKLAIGQEILIPKKKITSPYIDHEVESGIWSRRLANKFEISRERFRYFNPDIGWRTRPGDEIRIPIADHLSLSPVLPSLPDSTIKVELPEVPEEEIEKLIFCPDQPAHTDAFFRVALMVPFFLDEFEDIQYAKQFDPNADLSQLRDERPFSFLQFYEGFMIAVDSLVNSRGLKLELFVYDVGQHPHEAENVLNEPALLQTDLIIGPFFSRSFDIVAQFAREQHIPIVNPLAQRSQIVEEFPNVIKVKPNTDCQYEQVAQMIADNYPDAKVFIYRAHGFTDFEASRKMQEALDRFIKPDVPVANQLIYNLADRRTRGFEGMMDMIPAITVEGRTFYTDVLREELYDATVFDNSITEFVYARDSIREFAREASALRDNVVIAITEDNVFAMEFVNKLNQVADTFSVKLIGLPNWKQFDNLFIESLLKIQAHYLEPGQIDYTTYKTEQFIHAYRNRFESEPGNYAFEGFDIGWYFLQALMHYGNGMIDCLPYFSPELSHTRFHFKRHGHESGMENCFWSIYRYQNYQRVPIWNTYFIKNTDL